jgi:hypothetical protein
MHDDTWRSLVDATAPTRGRQILPLPQLWAARVATGDRMCRRLVVELARPADDWGRGTVTLRTLARAAGTTATTLRVHLPHLLEQGALLVVIPERTAAAQDHPMPYWLSSPLPPAPCGDR